MRRVAFNSHIPNGVVGQDPEGLVDGLHLVGDHAHHRLRADPGCRADYYADHFADAETAADHLADRGHH